MAGVEFEEWVRSRPVEVLRAFIGQGWRTRDIPGPEALRRVLEEPGPRSAAAESHRIETEALAWAAAQDPAFLHGRKFRYGLAL